jgi:hypothetical protein
MEKYCSVYLLPVFLNCHDLYANFMLKSTFHSAVHFISSRKQNFSKQHFKKPKWAISGIKQYIPKNNTDEHLVMSTNNQEVRKLIRVSL